MEAFKIDQIRHETGSTEEMDPTVNKVMFNGPIFIHNYLYCNNILNDYLFHRITVSPCLTQWIIVGNTPC